MAPLEGVHRVRKRQASGFAEYWYAWRGGPQILSVTATTERLRDLKVQAAAVDAGARYYELRKARTSPAEGTIDALAVMWAGKDEEHASPEFKLLGARTRKDLRKHLALVRGDVGDMPLAALEAKGARKALIDKRNLYKDRPRLADHWASAVSQLLVWARNQGHTAADPMRDWPWIYKVDRSGITWTAVELETLASCSELELQLMVLGAAYSGLRKSDQLLLTKSAIAGDTITRRTSKRGRVVDIPISPVLRSVLEAALAVSPADCPYVFTKDGAPWKASTLDKRFNLARKAAIAMCPSIRGKRWHDLRGSFATFLTRSGLDDARIDKIMGWKPGKSELTRASYVSGSVVAELALQRIRQFTQSA